jgi:predicted glycosyltransferase
MKRRDHVRILMYSHDTFGLGHLRRCRIIAHHLAERFGGMHILIISGSPIAGAFDFKARVDFIKIPSVIKLRNGEYTSIAHHMDLDDTMHMRGAMIRDTAKTFDPDIFIVDKEPVGLRGELEDTLHYLNGHGCSLVLGLRDVMDAPELLAAEWQRKDVLPKVEALYHQIWVYGPEGFWDPAEGARGFGGPALPHDLLRFPPPNRAAVLRPHLGQRWQLHSGHHRRRRRRCGAVAPGAGRLRVR